MKKRILGAFLALLLLAAVSVAPARHEVSGAVAGSEASVMGRAVIASRPVVIFTHDTGGQTVIAERPTAVLTPEMPAADAGTDRPVVIFTPDTDRQTVIAERPAVIFSPDAAAVMASSEEPEEIGTDEESPEALPEECMDDLGVSLPVEMMPEPETFQEPGRRYLGRYYVTGYDKCFDCCGKTDGVTFYGVTATVGRTVSAPEELEFGTRLYIDGLGERVVEDRGGAITGNRLDIFCEDHPACWSVTGWYDVYEILE